MKALKYPQRAAESAVCRGLAIRLRLLPGFAGIDLANRMLYRFLSIIRERRMRDERIAETIFAAIDAAVISDAASQARNLHRPYGLVAIFADLASTEAYKAFCVRTLEANPQIKEIEFVSRFTASGPCVNIPDRICLWFEKPWWFKRLRLDFNDQYVTSEKILDAVRPPPPQGFKSTARRPGNS
jgi:hypothetical protein